MEVRQDIQDFGPGGGRLTEVRHIYKAAVQATLFFVLETLVMNPRTRQNLRGFHHRLGRQLAGMKT